MSIAGGYYKALDRSREVDCTAVQLFTKNANQWAGKPITEEDVLNFRTTCEGVGYNLDSVLAHDSYLINLATPDDILWVKSLDAFGHELDRCAMLGIPALVTHAGAHVGSGEESGLVRIAEGLDLVLSQRAGQNVTVLLETTAGQGTSLGYTFEHLARVIGLLKDEHKARVAVCWDTCHLFAAGMDFTDEDRYERMVESFDTLIGLDKLRGIHLNDSKKGLGSRVDRHEHIGQGMLGIEPFRFILNDQRLADIPKVIETPKGADMTEDKMNLDLLRSLVR